ncbi:DUF7848 domain-containing protein [Streptomyces mirabilis]
MSRATFRYVPFTTSQDPAVEPEYSAYCVVGEAESCGANSGILAGAIAVDDWMRGHMKETGHTEFRRRFDDFAILRRSDGLPTELERARVERVTVPPA